MNSLTWIGIILWGLVLAGFGVVSAGAPPEPGAPELAPHDVIFLLAGGVLTCMIGMVGLLGFIGWIPGLRGDQQRGA